MSYPNPQETPIASTTGTTPNPDAPKPTRYSLAWFREQGRIGGKRRSERLSKAERVAIASKGGQAFKTLYTGKPRPPRNPRRTPRRSPSQKKIEINPLTPAPLDSSLSPSA